jgi:hypothetical protein
MARGTRPTRTKSAGIVSLAEVARHWQVSPATASEILRLSGVQDTGLRKGPTYRRKDIWRVEGVPDVPEALWVEYWEPLLTPADLAEIMPDKDPRTIRRDLESRRWPVIDLGERTRRVRARELAREIEMRSVKRWARKVRSENAPTTGT